MNSYQKFLYYLNQFLDKKYFSLKLIFFILIINLLFLIAKYPVRDSLHYHFASFNFIANFIYQYKSFPIIYPEEGGVDIGLSIMSFGILMPQHIIGYVFSGFFSNFLIYKISFLMGIYFYSLGIYYLFKKIYTPHIAAKCSLLSAIFGIGLSFHQEQVIYTVIFYPWLYLFLKTYSEDQDNLKVVIILGYILGSLTYTHQPQIHIFGIMIIIFLSFNFKQYFKNFSIKSNLILLIVIIFFSYPTIYFLNNVDQIFYPIRHAKGVVDVLNYDDYIKLNSIDASTLFHNISKINDVLKIIILGKSNIDDHLSLYIGIPLFILIALSFIILIKYNLKKFINYIVAITILIILGTGNNLFNFHTKILFEYLPLIFGTFRQWYHFFPLINFILIILIGCSLNYVKNNKKITIVINIIIFTALINNFYFINSSFKHNTTSREPPVFIPLVDQTHIKNNPNLINYKDRGLLCKDHIVRVEPVNFPEHVPLIFSNTIFNKEDNCYSIKDNLNNIYPNPYIKQKYITYDNYDDKNSKTMLKKQFGYIDNYINSNNQLIIHGSAIDKNYKNVDEVIVVINNQYTCRTKPGKIRINKNKINKINFRCDFGITPFDKIFDLRLIALKNNNAYEYEINDSIISNLKKESFKKHLMADFLFYKNSFIIKTKQPLITNEFNINVNYNIVEEILIDQKIINFEKNEFGMIKILNVSDPKIIEIKIKKNLIYYFNNLMIYGFLALLFAYLFQLIFLYKKKHFN